MRELEKQRVQHLVQDSIEYGNEPASRKFVLACFGAAAVLQALMTLAVLAGR